MAPPRVVTPGLSLGVGYRLAFWRWSQLAQPHRQDCGIVMSHGRRVGPKGRLFTTANLPSAGAELLVFQGPAAWGAARAPRGVEVSPPSSRPALRRASAS